MEENKWIIGGKDIRKKIKKNNQKYKIKYLSQGAYGCIFYPGLTCNLNTQSKKYISKIEIRKKTVIKEFEISKHIRDNIKNYNTMFAPILSYCPISISKINKNLVKEVKDCDLIQKKDKLIYSTKIRYVGNYTLEPYLYSILEENDFSFFNKQLFETHIYLTNSIEKLVQHQIVHFDIKENNIMYDNGQFLPIIIDFGLSFRIDLLTSEISYKNAFIYFTNTCDWWCLEISIISFIVHKKYDIYNEQKNTPSSWMKDYISIQNLLQIIEDYYANNYNIKIISNFWNNEVEESKQKWIYYISNILYTRDNSGEYKKVTGEEIVKAIMQSWDTWDMFSLSYIYLYFLQNLRLNSFKDYQNFLVKYILAFPIEIENKPSERIKIKDYYDQLVTFSEEYVELENITFNKEEYKEKRKNKFFKNQKLEKIISQL